MTVEYKGFPSENTYIEARLINHDCGKNLDFISIVKSLIHF